MEMSKKELDRILKLFNISGDSLNTFYPKITEPLVPISAIGITAYDFFTWKGKLINVEEHEESEKSGKWVKLNLLEVVWVKIIAALKSLGLPNQDIITIKEILNADMQPFLINNIDEILRTFDEKIIDKEKAMVLKNFVEIVKTNPAMIDSKYFKLLTPLAAILSDILLQGSEISLIGYKEEGSFFFAFEGLKMNDIIKKTLKKIKSLPHIIIPINPLIKDFIDENEEHALMFGLILNQEKEVLDALRNDNIKEINIKKNKGAEITLTTIEIKELKDDDAKKFIHILRTSAYNEIKVVTRNNKHLIILNKKKKKI